VSAPEFWRARRDDPLLPGQSADPERREVLANVLNLDLLAEGVFLDPDGPLRYYSQRLEGTQAAAWAWWFRITYSRYLEEWQDFEGEMPTEVMEELNVALQLGVFDDIEIWTPGERDDFVAVGIVHLDVEDDETGLFPIARWGPNRTPDSRIMAEHEARGEHTRRGRNARVSHPDGEFARRERRKTQLQAAVLLLLAAILLWLFTTWGD
jgi:hypothetical protein